MTTTASAGSSADTVHLELPPLRSGLADVPLLAEHFVERACIRHHLDAKVLSQMMAVSTGRSSFGLGTSRSSMYTLVRRSSVSSVSNVT